MSDRLKLWLLYEAIRSNHFTALCLFSLEVNLWQGRAGVGATPGLVAASVLKHLGLPVPDLMLFWTSTSSGGRENEVKVSVAQLCLTLRPHGL